jgi:hypothetical protein
MKIGILTFHRSINNGAVMQCYSLSKRLQQEFPDDTIEVIDYHMPKVEASYTPTLRRYFAGADFLVKAKRAVKLILDPFAIKWKKKRKKVFESVVDVLPLSDHRIFADDTTELFRYVNETYDVVIAGSDAIWNYVSRGFPNPYFLDTSVKCHKLSYAASCYGMNYEKIPKEYRIRIGEILNSYCFIGARDGESEKFVAYVGSTAPLAHTCDPTVFLDVDNLPIDTDYVILKLKSRGFDFSKKTIGVMGSDKMCRMVRKLYGNSVQIVALYNYHKEADVNLYDLTPYEWAYVFRFFQATVTTYFHGTHLSLRNGTPVVCVALETEYAKNHKTKVQDFLERIGLQDWYFHSDYVTFGVSEIRAQLDYFLSSDLKADILSRMDRESESFNHFLEELKKLKD